MVVVKSTLVKHLNGLLQPTGGSVIVKGRDTRKSTVFEIGQDVGYAFQIQTIKYLQTQYMMKWLLVLK